MAAVPSENIVSNYFEVNIKDSIYKYKVDVEPNPPNRLFIVNKCLRANRDALIQALGQQYIFLNMMIFTKRNSENLSFDSPVDGVKYPSAL